MNDYEIKEEAIEQLAKSINFYFLPLYSWLKSLVFDTNVDCVELNLDPESD